MSDFFSKEEELQALLDKLPVPEGSSEIANDVSHVKMLVQELICLLHVQSVDMEQLNGEIDTKGRDQDIVRSLTMEKHKNMALQEVVKEHAELSESCKNMQTKCNSLNEKLLEKEKYIQELVAMVVHERREKEMVLQHYNKHESTLESYNNILSEKDNKLQSLLNLYNTEKSKKEVVKKTYEDSKSVPKH